MTTVRIPLGGRGRTPRAFALVDERDAAALMADRWYLDHSGYAMRTVVIDGKQRTVFMHRVLLGLVPGDGMQADHINRDRLDNRRANLRAVTPAENAQNFSSKGGTSPYRNVAWHKGHRAWRVAVRVNGRQRFVGYFADELTAARAAEAFRREHMPFAQPEPLLAETQGEAA